VVPRRSWGAAGLVLACLAASAGEAPVLRAVEVRGCSAYSREGVLRIVRLDAGRRLEAQPSAIAAALEARYRDDGYPAARVSAELEPATGTLTLSVDEGTLAGVETPGLEGRARARALEALGLAPGRVLRDLDLDEALLRLEEASRGALERDEPAYEVEHTPEGARVVIRVRRRLVRPRLRLDAVGAQAVYDRVSGFSPRLGAEIAVADLRSYDPTTLYGQAAHGLEAKVTRFAVGAWRSFFAGRAVAGYELHDLTDTDDEFRALGIDAGPGSALGFRAFSDHFVRRGHEAYVLARLSPRWRAGLTYRSDAYLSLPAVTGSASDPPEPNPPVDEGVLRSVIASLQWSSQAGLFEGVREAQRSALMRSLYTRPLAAPPPFTLGVSFEWASRGLGGDLSFRRLIAEGRSRHPLTVRGALGARLLLGVAGGDVPVQKRFALGGLGTLRGYDEKEFDGEGFLLANLEWSLHTGRLLPALIPFADAGATWRGFRTTGGVRADLGLGLRWPAASALFVRLDAAVAVTRGGAGVRVTGLAHFPF